MDEPRFCPLWSTTEAAFDAVDHEDLKPEFDNIEVYDCPKCDGQHRYHNGRFTLAPVTFECGWCGDPIESIVGPGGRRYCDRSCERKARERALEAMEELGL